MIIFAVTVTIHVKHEFVRQLPVFSLVPRTTGPLLGPIRPPLSATTNGAARVGRCAGEFGGGSTAARCAVSRVRGPWRGRNRFKSDETGTNW